MADYDEVFAATPPILKRMQGKTPPRCSETQAAIHTQG